MRILVQFVAAAVGTVAFGSILGVPARYYPPCGFIGAAGWIVYVVLWEMNHIWSEPVGIFLATVLVILLSRFFAVLKRCPVTIFLVSGILPLVPGAGIYWTAYYLVTNQLAEAAVRGVAAVKVALSIVLGIVLVFELPQRVFTWPMERFLKWEGQDRGIGDRKKG